jgi:hypothetical protein
MTIGEFNLALENLGFSESTKKIEVGIVVYSMLKKELGNFANKFKGVNFVLNTSLGGEEITLI